MLRRAKTARGPHEGTIRVDIDGVPLVRRTVLCHADGWAELLRARPELAGWCHTRLGDQMLATEPPPRAMIECFRLGRALFGRPGRRGVLMHGDALN